MAPLLQEDFHAKFYEESLPIFLRFVAQEETP